MKLKFLCVVNMCLLLFGCQSLDVRSKKNLVVKESLELNPGIIIGKLDNGLTYFIQENAKPENRIELRLIVNTGSIQENDDQKGLAHFVEHMAFNGTENFKKNKLIKYLESLGMGFGPDINAHTSFDETVYKLSIPADDPEIISNAFLILEDWAHRMSFDDEEIEKERGVIVEEWRGGRGVQGRYLDILYPTLLKNSRYAERLPIGDMDIVKNCDPQKLRDYYNEWYRPESMAVAVVGNIDSNAVKAEIEKHFNFFNDYDSREKTIYETPILDRIDVEIIPDPEMTYSEILYLIKRKNLKMDSVENYREYIKELLAILMFNSRMEEIYTQSDSPFLSAGSGFSSIVRNSSVILVSTRVEEGKVESGFKATLEEIEKVKQFGFDPDELDRAKALINMIMTNYYNERENTKSASLANEIITYFLEGNVVMDIAYEYELIGKIMDGISYKEVNRAGIDLFSSKDRTITVHVPVNSEIVLPGKDDIIDLFKKVSEKTYEKRIIENEDRILFNMELKSGEVISRIEDNGITTIILNNGATVVLKPTDFKADEINFSAISYGGLSHVEDEEYYSGNISANTAVMSGLNGFDKIALDRILTGVNASVSPWIGNYTEGLSGGSNVADKEVLFQLINLFFTKPEFSEESYEVYLTNIKNYINNRENSPKTIFNDKVNEILGSSHFRSKAITLESLDEVDFQEVKDIYSERFADAGDFYYVFTGNFDVDEFIPLIELYIGSIPSSNIKESARDVGYRHPLGVVEESVVKGIEEQSTIEIIYSGNFDGTEEDEFLIPLLCNYLEEKLRVLVREDMGGTYGVSVFSNISLYPVKQYSIGIYFGCEPGRENELSEAVFKELAKVRNGKIDTESLDAVINNFKNNMELNIKDNQYWLHNLASMTLLGRDYNSITDDDTSAVTSEKFVELTNKYLNQERFIKVLLKPE